QKVSATQRVVGHHGHSARRRQGCRRLEETACEKDHSEPRCAPHSEVGLCIWRARRLQCCDIRRFARMEGRALFLWSQQAHDPSMRTLGGAAFILAFTVAGVADATEVTIIGGGAALANFEQVSADGCVIIDGQIAVVQARHGNGDLANGVYIVATRQDVCLPDYGNGYAGFTEGNFGVNGLASAHYTGSAVVESYSGGPPLTFDLNLSWSGTGSVSRTRNVFKDGSTISFTFDASRNATTQGTF